jgi:glycosyltransferase involved in cell wall biosynthesis
MNIAMFTNAYKPIVGGQERSVEIFTEDLRNAGHQVLVVTLSMPGAEESDETTFRLPAVKEVGNTPFSIKLPIPAGLPDRLDAFQPDIIHSHHPFMLGDTALRVARRRGRPLVFTHHTLYERYVYLFNRESDIFRQIAMSIATEYANLCDVVVAPTHSIKHVIRERGVVAPIEVIPTGIDIALYSSGDGAAFRQRYGIPEHVFVLGYLGRVVEAKNMSFLAKAAASFLQQHEEARFLIAGDGESREPVEHGLEEAGVADRVIFTGEIEGRSVADAYAAMDLFAFASTTDTQGIVIIESLCAGVPVVALDATGVRDIVQNGHNGLLLRQDCTPQEFAGELLCICRDEDRLARWRESARERAADFAHDQCAEQLMKTYRHLIRHPKAVKPESPQPWQELQQRFAAEWELFREKLSVVVNAITESNGF